MTKYHSSILCINCETYIEPQFIDIHSYACNLPKPHDDTIPARINKLKDALEYRCDCCSIRAVELCVLLRNENITEKQLYDYYQEALILQTMQSDDLLLDRLVLFTKHTLLNLLKIQKSIQNRTRDTSLSTSMTKEDILKRIELRRSQVDSYRMEAETLRMRTIESQIKIGEYYSQSK